MTKRQGHVPSMSEAIVRAKSGQDWATWFDVLDTAGAMTLGHQAITDIVSRRPGVSSWWCQMIAVEYERARGLRKRHETSSGFSVSVSKTVAASLSDVYQAAAHAAKRAKWFPKGAFTASSQTKDKYLRGSWKKSARLEFGFYAKGKGKAQIAVQINKLAKESDVERERAAWKAALGKLEATIAPRR
jgi:hypothetical protein